MEVGAIQENGTDVEGLLRVRLSHSPMSAQPPQADLNAPSRDVAQVPCVHGSELTRTTTPSSVLAIADEVIDRCIFRPRFLTPRYA